MPFNTIQIVLWQVCLEGRDQEAFLYIEKLIIVMSYILEWEA